MTGSGISAEKTRGEEEENEKSERETEIKGVLLITVRTGVTGPREASAFLRRLVKCPWYSAAGNIFRLRLSKDPTLTFHLTRVFAFSPRYFLPPSPPPPSAPSLDSVLNPIRQPCAVKIAIKQLSLNEAAKI